MMGLNFMLEKSGHITRSSKMRDEWREIKLSRVCALIQTWPPSWK
jgi:hypothetical protein